MGWAVGLGHRGGVEWRKSYWGLKDVIEVPFHPHQLLCGMRISPRIHVIRLAEQGLTEVEGQAICKTPTPNFTVSLGGLGRLLSQ